MNRFVVGDIVRYWPFSEPFPEPCEDETIMERKEREGAERTHQGRVVRVSPDGSTVDVQFAGSKATETYKRDELSFHKRPR